MSVFKWFVLALLGFGLMVLAFELRPRVDPESIWGHGRMAVGVEGRTDAKPVGLAVDATLRLLPGTPRAEEVLKAMATARPGKTLGLEVELRPKLVRLSLADARIDSKALESGRMPVPGRDEVLAGSVVIMYGPGRVQLGDRILAVVGSLRPDLSLFSDCYLLPAAATNDALFPKGDASVHPAVMLGLTRHEARDARRTAELDRSFKGKVTWHAYPLRMPRGAYTLYVVGQFVFLIAGSGVLFGVYRAAAARVGKHWLRAPLEELVRRPRLFWGVHLVYFGLVAVASLLVFEVTDIQSALMSSIRGQISGEDGAGPLAAAGAAYGSGSILRAAAVTFLVNFFIGSLLCITVPSVIVPGSGVLLAVFRAFLWGGLLGPTLVVMAGTMLPHSGTMLLEGEGYILATFFAVLVPVQMVRSEMTGTMFSGFRRAVVLNLQANVLVAIVLAVAALYEATELILMMKLM